MEWNIVFGIVRHVKIIFLTGMYATAGSPGYVSDFLYAYRCYLHAGSNPSRISRPGVSAGVGVGGARGRWDQYSFCIRHNVALFCGKIFVRALACDLVMNIEQ